MRVTATECVRYAKASEGLRARNLMLAGEPSVGAWSKYIKTVILPRYARNGREAFASMSPIELGVAATRLRDYYLWR